MADAPKVFISHATEDKERFVRAFATALRERGIDAWFDEWELSPGDSLVQRIFDQGIAKASAFIVVVSDVSVTKPWVREELDLGVVRRIEEGCRLIPLVLDNADVPQALRSTVWVPVADPTDFTRELDRVLAAIYGQSGRPPIGSPPAYTRRRPGESVDAFVLDAIVEEAIAQNQRHIRLDGVRERLAQSGVGSDAFVEALHALQAERLLDVQFWGAPGAPPGCTVTTRTLLRHLERSGVDVQAELRRVAAEVYNEAASFSPDIANVVLRKPMPSITEEALHQAFADRGLYKVSRFLGSTHLGIAGISPLLRRQASDE